MLRSPSKMMTLLKLLLGRWILRLLSLGLFIPLKPSISHLLCITQVCFSSFYLVYWTTKSIIIDNKLELSLVFEPQSTITSFCVTWIWSKKLASESWNMSLQVCSSVFFSCVWTKNLPLPTTNSSFLQFFSLIFSVWLLDLV